MLMGLGASIAAGAVVSPVSRLATPSEVAALSTSDGNRTYCITDPTFDTMAGIASFAVPGDDVFSQTQGVVTAGPAGVAAGTPQFLTMVFNQVLLDPTTIMMLVERLRPLLEKVIFPDGTDACASIGSAIRQRNTLPLAPVVVALINGLAIEVDPTSAAGAHAAPFPRLSWHEKAKVWRRLEYDLPRQLEPPEWTLESPVLRNLAEAIESIAGIIEYVGGVTLPLAAFFAYSETLYHDRERQALTERPVGWDRSNYMPGRLWPADGWDDFKGYYQGRSSVA